MIILVYLRNLLDNLKVITKNFLHFLIFEGNILTSKNYNISLELVHINTYFEK